MAKVITVANDTVVCLNSRGNTFQKLNVQAFHDATNNVTVYGSIDEVNFVKIKQYTASGIDDTVIFPYIFVSSLNGAAQTLTELEAATDVAGTSKVIVYTE